MRSVGFTWKTLASEIKMLFVLHGVGDESEPVCSSYFTVAKYLKSSAFERKGFPWLAM